MKHSIPSLSRLVWCVGLAGVCSGVAGAAPVQQAYVKPTNPQNQARFGRAVAVSGNTMVVGAPYENSNSTGVGGAQNNTGATKSGAAYVYVRTGDTWVQQAFLKADNAQAGDEFGISVAISGNTIVVGAHFEDGGVAGVNGDGSSNSAFNSGAAYVFVRTGSTWTQQAYLKAEAPGGDDYYGVSLGISGDTVVVGTSDEDSSATGVTTDWANNGRFNSGAVYVYQRTGTTWARQAYLKASNPDIADYFGGAVAISGNTLVVGAKFESSNSGSAPANNGANNAGAAYVFLRTGTTWAQQAYLKPTTVGADDEFGTAVAIHGDTVVVGAPGEDSAAITVNGLATDNSASSAGAAYVFQRTGTAWTQQAYLKALNAQSPDLYGGAVAVSLNAVAVGAVNEAGGTTGIGGNPADNSQMLAGAVYLYSRTGSTWSAREYVKASNTNGYDEFGGCVALGGATLAVGAMKEASNSPGINGNQANNSLSEAGAVYVFTGVEAAAAADIRITGMTKSSNSVTLRFSSTAGLSAAGWQVQGSADLLGWPDVLTGSTITEPTAGNYQAVVDVTGKPAGKYFLRVAR